MKIRFKKLAEHIERIVNYAGWLSGLLIYPIIACLFFAVVARYAFSAPSMWAGELSSMLYAVYFLVGGAYALLHKEHVRVDVLYSYCSERVRIILDLLTSCVFFLYVGVLFWLSLDFAFQSFLRNETSSSVWAPYIWPIKAFLPIATFLMLVTGLIAVIRRAHALFSGSAHSSDHTSEHA